MRQPFVFGSYNSADKEAALQFFECLRTHGVALWIDRDISPGAKWKSEIHSKMESAAAAVIAIGDHGVSRRFQLCVEIPSLSRQEEQGCHIVPVRLPGSAQRKPVPGRLKVFQRYDFDGKDCSQLAQLLLEICGAIGGASQATNTEPPAPAASGGLFKIVFAASNPIDTPELKLNDELQEITKGIQSVLGDAWNRCFKIVRILKARREDLVSDLRQSEPIDILHFSGHGSEKGDWLLQNNQGRSATVGPAALGKLIGLLDPIPKVVVLNACYSDKHAAEIAQHGPVVIGMRRAVSDKSAIAFAREFYAALAEGKSVGDAFRWGCVQVEIDSFKERDVPQIRPSAKKADQLRFVCPSMRTHVRSPITPASEIRNPSRSRQEAPTKKLVKFLATVPDGAPLSLFDAKGWDEISRLDNFVDLAHGGTRQVVIEKSSAGLMLHFTPPLLSGRNLHGPSIFLADLVTSSFDYWPRKLNNGRCYKIEKSPRKKNSFVIRATEPVSGAQRIQVDID